MFVNYGSRVIIYELKMVIILETGTCTIQAKRKSIFKGRNDSNIPIPTRLPL